MTTKEQTREVARRGFIGAIGVAAATTAAAAVTPLPWPAALEAWPDAFRQLVERFRPLYLAEVARLAESLRPGFEAGALRAITDEDVDAEVDGGAGSPMSKIRAAAGEHFKLIEAGSADDVCDGAGHIAEMILAVSDSAPYMDGWDDPVYEANEAVTWDVILLARERRWYTPGASEQIGRSFEESREIAARAAGIRS